MKQFATLFTLLALVACSERVDLPPAAVDNSNPITCALDSQTDTTVTFLCDDGTSVTVDKPVRTVEVEKKVEVPVVVEVPVEVCTDSKITICSDGETTVVSLSALSEFDGATIGACKGKPDPDPKCKKGYSYSRSAKKCKKDDDHGDSGSYSGHDGHDHGDSEDDGSSGERG